ncbi:MAG: thioredoxin family protein [Candidatus Anstonellales archaeon]
MEMDKNTAEIVRKKLSGMKGKVTIEFYGGDAEYSEEMKGLLQKLSELSGGKVELVEKKPTKEVIGFPAIRVHSNGKGYWFTGIPSGYEFSTFIESFLAVQSPEQHLPEDMVDRIKKLDKPVDIKVFVTPTCPYCPRAAFLAIILSSINPKISANIVEVSEFQDLGMKYHVYGVPKTVINETIYLEGAYPPDIVIQKLENL